LRTSAGEVCHGSTVRRWIWIAILVVIGAAALAMLGDVRQLGARLGGFGWPAFAAGLGLALANYVSRFVRWILDLRSQSLRVPLGGGARVFGAGLPLSITPAELGELAEGWGAAPQGSIAPPRPVRRWSPGAATLWFAAASAWCAWRPHRGGFGRAPAKVPRARDSLYSRRCR
jgi:hypothetical protein